MTERRTEIVHVRLTPAESRTLDLLKAHLTRSEFIRYLLRREARRRIAQARREGTR